MDIDVDSILNEDTTEISGLDLENDYEDVSPNNIPEKSQKPRQPRSNKKSEKDTKMIVIGCVSVVVFLIMLIIGFSLGNKSNSNKQPQQAQPVATTSANPSSADGSKKAGIDNLQADTQKKNTGEVENPSVLTADLTGKSVDANYQVKTVKTVTEVVGYTKHRTVLGNGLEFYWLDVDYKGQPYKVQVPFAVFKELSSVTGYVVVDAEVTTTSTDQQIITYMVVRKDQKTYLDKVGK